MANGPMCPECGQHNTVRIADGIARCRYGCGFFEVKTNAEIDDIWTKYGYSLCGTRSTSRCFRYTDKGRAYMYTTERECDDVGRSILKKLYIEKDACVYQHPEDKTVCMRTELPEGSVRPCSWSVDCPYRSTVLMGVV